MIYSLMKDFLRHIATLGFVGYLPIAPGTWGSLVGLFISLFLQPAFIPLLIMICATAFFGIISAEAAEDAFGEKDCSKIVIDELAGFWTATLLVPSTATNLIACFLLFRFFDILKPFPIRSIEKKLKGGIGIVADDIAAGVYANIIVQTWNRIP